MELRTVRTFLRVAELMSFSRAAESLHYTQSAVTIQIQQLEKELGVELFERIGKTICLTRYGEQFIPYAGGVVQAAQAAVNFLREPDTPKGPLRIGTVESLCAAILPGVLQELHAACPLVETVVRCSTIERLLHMLNHNEVDILYFLDRKTHNPNWITVTEQAADIVFVASASHALAGTGRIALRRMVDEPFILTEEGVNYRYELEHRLASRNMRLVPYLDIENTEIIIRMLGNNTSVSFLPEFAIHQDVEAGRLAILDVGDIKVKMWKQLIYHKKKTVTPQMQYFMEQICAAHASAVCTKARKVFGFSTP